MKRYIFIGCMIALITSASPFLFHLANQYIVHIRHRMQEHFSEVHAMLHDNDDDQPFGDGTLTEDQITARDSVVTPLATVPGMIAWDILAQAQTKVEEHSQQNAITPIYNKAIENLDQKELTARGYMFPLDVIGKQGHFLLSPYPPSCPFCQPAGPNELIEIKMQDPIEFSYDPITIRGHFELMTKDKDIGQGVFYRMENAKPIL